MSRPPRRLAAYGSTNMYRPLNISRKSGIFFSRVGRKEGASGTRGLRIFAATQSGGLHSVRAKTCSRFRKELLPAVLGALVILRWSGRKPACSMRRCVSRRRRREREGHDALEAQGAPGVGQRLVRLDGEHLAIDDAVPVGGSAQTESVADDRREVVLHQPFRDQMRLRERAPDLFRRIRHLAFDDDGTAFRSRLIGPSFSTSFEPSKRSRQNAPYSSSSRSVAPAPWAARVMGLAALAAVAHQAGALEHAEMF